MPELPPLPTVREVSNKDAQLIEGLIRATQDGKVRWFPTAKLQEFTASFRGKFSVVVSETPPGQIQRLLSSEPVYELRVEDELGTVLHTISGPSIKPLLEAASRSSVSADRDRAINEILEELDQRTKPMVNPGA
jgi:hypothetical protein